jgi:ABC-type transporter Mla MlaB component
VGDIWFAALFDLYRCTDQRTKFDALALDYAQQWGQSAPLWFSVPARWAKGSSVLQPVAGTSPAEQCTRWQCPALLDVQALASLRETAASDSSVLVLDWSGLTQIAPSAVLLLADLVAQWCEQTHTWHFEAVHVILNLLRLATPVSNNEIEAHWWYLRLDMLRILHMQDDYELAALDYCVTFEVSPPPWREARCFYMENITLASGVPVVTLEEQASVSGNGHVDSSHTSLLEPDPVPLLEAKIGGELLGDMAQNLLPSEQHFKTTDAMVISCSNLIRVDFSAAGSILNWATTGQAMGCHIEFVDVAHLVAVFFNLIGINEHARVVVRTM